ncbi:MAG: hypothetical protein LBC59_07985 [Chitinispirillales bacterium]|jgi:hypothetical protein|nr:hypothetical protein [Chitinispirillales bacterium]
MNALKTITQRIEDGFVLNEQGRWLYMAEQRIYERRVIEQIVNGNVLVDGKWVAIGEARRLALRNKAAAQRKPAQPPAPAVTPLMPQPHTETAAFEAMGDMMETICMDMSAMMKPPEVNTAEEDDGPAPAHVDSVLIYGLSTSTAADQSKYAMAYIDERNLSRKRGGIGISAKLAIAAAAIAGIAFVVIQKCLN